MGSVLLFGLAANRSWAARPSVWPNPLDSGVTSPDGAREAAQRTGLRQPDTRHATERPVHLQRLRERRHERRIGEWIEAGLPPQANDVEHVRLPNRSEEHTS